MRRTQSWKVAGILLSLLLLGGCLVGVGAMVGVGAYQWMEGTMQRTTPGQWNPPTVPAWKPARS